MIPLFTHPKTLNPIVPAPRSFGDLRAFAVQIKKRDSGGFCDHRDPSAALAQTEGRIQTVELRGPHMKRIEIARGRIKRSPFPSEALPIRHLLYR